MYKCQRCERNFVAYVDMLRTVVDEVFVASYGWSEYFNAARKVFVNPVPSVVTWNAYHDEVVIRIVDAFYACPYCDHIHIDNPLPYFKKCEADLIKYERS